MEEIRMARYRFDDIAFNITDKRMPTPDDKDLYIGLEHLDTRCLRVSRWGSAVDITGQKLVMRKGDLLFGRRNTYLRRAAIAPHDGLFSAHGMIFRPKTDVITEEFFPYFIVSNYFMDAAIRISVGSLSPTVNWKQLKELEFDIPDIDKQHKYAELFAAIDSTKEAYKHLISSTDKLVKSQFIEMFGDPVENPMGWSTRSLLTLGTCKNGMNFHSNDSGVEINCLGVGDFKDYDVIENTYVLPTVSLNTMPTEEYLLRDADIVFVRSNGNKTMVGRSIVVYPGDNPTTFSGFCIRYRNADASIMVPYLLRVFKTDSVRKRMYGRGANIQNLNQQTLASLNIPIPPMILQEQYVSFVEQADKSKFEAKQALESLDVLYQNIEKQCFC